MGEQFRTLGTVVWEQVSNKPMHRYIVFHGRFFLLHILFSFMISILEHTHEYTIAFVIRMTNPVAIDVRAIIPMYVKGWNSLLV